MRGVGKESVVSEIVLGIVLAALLGYSFIEVGSEFPSVGKPIILAGKFSLALALLLSCVLIVGIILAVVSVMLKGRG